MDMLLFAGLGFVVGWIAGSRVAAIWHVMSFTKIMEDLGVSQQQLQKLARDNGVAVPEDSVSADPQLITVRVEHMHGQWYAFRQSDDHFLGQHPDRDQLVRDLAHHAAPGQQLVITDSA